MLAIGREQCTDEPDAETHLYLTDYRTLYVAHIAEITADDPRKDPAERARIPAYYLADGRVADFWFRPWDIRRLVQEDTESVIRDLQQLRHVRYGDRPVSIYGGMLDLPLIVTEPEPVECFDEATRAHVTGVGPALVDFARYRNPAAHEAVAGRADVIRWRQRILGIGCEGVLVRLGMLKPT